MGFQFTQSEKVRAGVRRIAVERIDKAIAVVDPARTTEASRENIDLAVHDARKRCKELRALIRLVRPSFDGYQRENAAFRTAARLLADLRDATTVLDAFDALTEDDTERFAPVRGALATERAELSSDTGERLQAFAKRMAEARQRARKWTLEDQGFDAIGPGLERTYARCQSAMQCAIKKPSIDNLHEWRKLVKYNRTHLRLLRGLFAPVIEPVRGQAKRLSDLLGDHHDLAMLADAIDSIDAGEPAVNAQLRKQLHQRISERCQAIEAEAFDLGRRLYAQKPSHYRSHAELLWRARS